DYGRSPASAHWSPPQLWPSSAVGLPFAGDATSQLGLSAEERRRRKNSPTARRKTRWRKCVPRDRAIYSDSPPNGRIHLRGLSLPPISTLLQFGGGPYIFAN